MDVKITPSSLHGTISAITSKSDAHRALICAALSDKDTVIKIDNTSKDIEATISCIEKMGGKVSKDGSFYTVSPITKKEISPVLDCFESGSTLRFLFPVANLVCENPTFTGRGRLPERPLSPLREEMSAHGIEILGNVLPITTKGRLSGGTYKLAGNVSSQFISGLLFALPMCGRDSRIVLTTPLESVGYVNMTLATLKLFGIEITVGKDEYIIKGNQKYISPKHLCVEGDWSNAAFWLCSGAMSDEITVDNLNFSSHQGDMQILYVLETLGAQVLKSENAVTIKKDKLSAITLDCTNIPDLVPIISAVASVAQGKTVLSGVSRLKIKESDRLSAICDVLTKLGADIQATDDSLIINGKQSLKGGVVDGYNDHRIVMTAAIAAKACKEPVTITGSEATKKSYPDFFKHYKQLGGIIDVI